MIKKVTSVDTVVGLLFSVTLLPICVIGLFAVSI